MALAFQDVMKLATATSKKERIEVAGKVAEGFVNGGMNGREKDLAIEIFRLLVKDAEIKVRQALSVQLCRSKEVPQDIILTLAGDIDDVAEPVLEYSPMLEDADLIAIIRSSRRTAKLAAIARRKTISYELSDLLLETADPTVTATLFANRGAQLYEKSILHTIQVMAEQESVIDALVERGGLPLSCVEKIFTLVSMQMKRRLAEHYQVSRHLIEGKMEYAREWATLGATVAADDRNVEALVKELMEKRKLTSSMVVRALCVGDLRFFEQAMSALTGLPVANVQHLMRDRGDGGFQSLYRQSPLPPAYYAAIKKLLDVILETLQNGEGHVSARIEDFSAHVVNGIVARGYDRSVEYMPILLAIIQGSASSLADNRGFASA